MSVKLELRPRVSIDRKTGSCLSAQVKGTSKNSGQKFNMEYIGAGSGFEFSVYLYGDISENQDETCEYNEYLCKVLAAAKNEKLIFGGQKSNGCGDFEIKEIWHKQFNMLDADDRKRWAKEDKLVNSDYDDSDAFIQKISTLTDKLKSNTAYEITVTGNTEGELLVKSIATAGYGADAPDAENIRNAKGEYIIPGSSVKGAFRSQMEKIAGYINAYEKDAIINNIFGCVADDTDGGKVGNIRFYDTVIGKAEDNEKVHNAARIHIDKFTGGVIQGGLFSEKNTYGDITLRISIENKNNPEATLGLLVFALRDLAIGSMSLGSGYSVGKGFIDVKKIEIQKNGDIPSSVSIEFKNEENSGLEIDNDLIKEAIAALNGFKGGAE